MSKSSKKIKYLSEVEHVRLRSGMYVGSTNKTEEKIPIIVKDEENNYKLSFKTREISVGFYRLFEEIFDNAWDEALRSASLKNPMTSITIHVNSTTNSIEILDNGYGFLDPDQLNEETNLTNVETALTKTRASSNFENEETEEHLIGRNGIGSAVVNFLSSYFFVETVNGKIHYKQAWNEKMDTIEKEIIQIDDKNQHYTKIVFVPDKEIFKKVKWDKDILYAKVLTKELVRSNHPALKKLKIKFLFDDIEYSLENSWIPESSTKFLVQDKQNFSLVILWKKYEDSSSFSLVNSSPCSGLHQKIIQETLNSILGWNNAHQFYDTLVMVNLPPRVLKFADQNKTRATLSRNEILPYLDPIVKNIQENFPSDPFFKELKDLVDSRLIEDEVKKIKNAKKNSRVKISDKYHPSIREKDKIFLTEGNSAGGSILQRRDAQIDAVYTLRGKVKNTRELQDLTSNKEIIDLINILELDIQHPEKIPNYKKIIISADPDYDGYHITSLLINFFYQWFPNIIRNGYLYTLNLPIVSYNDSSNNVKYFYSLEDFEKEKLKKDIKNYRYFKGLGSFNLNDWSYIFSNLNLNKIVEDAHSKRSVDIAFGVDAKLRRLWLEH